MLKINLQAHSNHGYVYPGVNLYVRDAKDRDEADHEFALRGVIYGTLTVGIYDDNHERIGVRELTVALATPNSEGDIVL